jgi:hypothetical protein
MLMVYSLRPMKSAILDICKTFFFVVKTMDSFIWTIVQLRYMHLPIYLLEYVTI